MIDVVHGRRALPLARTLPWRPIEIEGADPGVKVGQ
jgi:hypothetical protein